MTDETDAELVAGLRLGSRAAVGRLAERHLHACRTVALAIVADVPAAEDIAQEAFIQAVERIDDCRQPDRFREWLLQIARNRAKNHLRDRAHGRHDPLEGSVLRSRAPAPDVAVERAQLRDRLLVAMAVLTETRREVLLLHDLEGWTHQEIAGLLELPIGTVRSHLHHARRAMRQEMEGWNE